MNCFVSKITPMLVLVYDISRLARMYTVFRSLNLWSKRTIQLSSLSLTPLGCMKLKLQESVVRSTQLLLPLPGLTASLQTATRGAIWGEVLTIAVSRLSLGSCATRLRVCA